MREYWTWDYELRDLGSFPAKSTYAGHNNPVVVAKVSDALECAAKIAEGDQSVMPMDSGDMDVGIGMVSILLPDMKDEVQIEKIGMLLAEHRAVTRQEERRSIALAIRQRQDQTEGGRDE